MRPSGSIVGGMTAAMDVLRPKRQRWLVALGLAVLVDPGAALGCPECRLAVRRAVHDGHFGARAAMAFAPFGAIGALAAGLAWWSDRRSKRSPR
jgi:hypothetical protein